MSVYDYDLVQDQVVTI